MLATWSMAGRLWRRGSELRSPPMVVVQVAAVHTRARTPARRVRTPPLPPASLAEHVDRKHALSVTDLVSPAWCEFAYLYNVLAQTHLPLSQRPTAITSPDGNVLTPSWAQWQARDKVLTAGTAIHDAKERELQPIALTFRVVAPVDRWALPILQYAIGMHAAWTSGCAREVPVLGVVHGKLVRGVVDEIRRDGDRLVLSDTKTRQRTSLPTKLDQLQAQLQCMLYKRLMDGMYTGLTGTWTPEHDPFLEVFQLAQLGTEGGVDIHAPLSPECTADLGTMVTTSATPWTPEDVQGLTLAKAAALASRTLQSLPCAAGGLSSTLELVYVHRTDGATIGTSAFAARPKELHAFLEQVFLLVQGRRTPQGVPLESTRRCDSCAWREGCEWRHEKALALPAKRPEKSGHAQAHALAHAAVYDTDDDLWKEFTIPTEELLQLEW